MDEGLENSAGAQDGNRCRTNWLRQSNKEADFARRLPLSKVPVKEKKSLEQKPGFCRFDCGVLWDLVVPGGRQTQRGFRGFWFFLVCWAGLWGFLL